jgi:hypothetical protein
MVLPDALPSAQANQTSGPKYAAGPKSTISIEGENLC